MTSPLRPGEYTIHDPPTDPPNGGAVLAINQLLLLLGGLALFIYPFVVLADLMSLAGEHSPHESPQGLQLIHLFIGSTLAYPVVFIACLVIVKLMAAKGRRAFSTLIAAFPIIYIVLLANFFFWLGSHVKA